jgi:hypothetical protein
MQVLVEECSDKRGEVTDGVKCKGKVEGDAITGIKVPDTVNLKVKWRGTLLQVLRDKSKLQAQIHCYILR